MQIGPGRFLATLFLPVTAFSPPDAVAAAVEISVQRLADASVVARYVFDEEITEFEFLIEDRALRDQWRVDERSLTLATDSVSSISGSPFRTATLTLRPSQDSPPASPTATPTLISMGPASTLVDLTHLRVRDAHAANFVVHDAFDEGARACVARRTIRLEPDELAVAARRYAFVSTTREACDAAVGDGEFAVFSADAPAALRQAITRDFAARYESLRNRVRTPVPESTLFVAHKSRQTGSITRVLSGAGGVFVAALEGDSWSAPTSISHENLMSSLSGSLMAAWLGHAEIVAPARSRPQPSWLASGAATYVAILDGIEHGHAGDDRVKARIDFVDLCARTTTSRRLESVEGPPIARSPRDCGLLVHLVYDAMTRAESASERTIYDLWAEAIAAPNGGDDVDPAAFLATNRRAEAALAGLLYGPEADFAPIVAALRTAGVDAVLGENPDSGGAVMNLVMSFLAKACPGVRFGIGFSGQETGIGFDTRDQCDDVPAKFRFMSIEARSIYSPARELHDAVGQACATQGSITLTGTTAAVPELRLGCPDEMPGIQASLKIRDLGILLP